MLITAQEVLCPLLQHRAASGGQQQAAAVASGGSSGGSSARAVPPGVLERLNIQLLLPGPLRQPHAM